LIIWSGASIFGPPYAPTSGWRSHHLLWYLAN